jgi:serine/threonine protein kinase
MSKPGQNTLALTKFCSVCHSQFPEAVINCPDDGNPLRLLQDDPLIGTVFADRYEILSVLGTGGMSMVYKARHKLMDRIVAIKILHQDLINEPTAIQRFQQESQAAASLTHQNVVTVYDFGISPQGQAFFVMDCLEGPTLADILDEEGPLPAERAVPIFSQVCDGLEAAHKKGIIHRDLKPGNVVLTTADDGTEFIKLVDFGIAKFLPQSGIHVQKLTQTGEVFGSPLFMSPEQCMGRPLDARSDIYALGVLMYDTLTGRPPVMGANFLETMNKHVGEKPPTFGDISPELNIPEAVETVVMKCLEKEPENRYQSAAEVKRALPYYGPSYGNTTSGGKVKRQRSTKVITVQLKADSKVLLGISAVALTILFAWVGFMAFWPGPDDDHGTPLNKLMWTLAMNAAEQCYTRHDFDGAKKCSEFGLALTDNFSDNYARLIFNLNEQAKILSALGQFDQLRQVNDRISQITVSRTVADYEKTMRMLYDLTIAKDAVKRSMNAVDAQASIERVFRASGSLNGLGLYDKQERLLKKAKDVFKDLKVQDDEATAKLDSQLADCLIHKQRTFEVRPLLVEALSLYRQSKNADAADNSLLALLKLGVFDKDQSNWAPAKRELEQAVALSKNHKDPHLEQLCLNGLADYYHQMRDEAQAKKLFAEASKLAQ